MKQIVQSLRTGETTIAEVPTPQPGAAELLIATSTSLISAGTERMLLEFGRSNWIERARQQPDKVRMVLDKIRTDGLLPALEAVRSKLDRPLPLGYCNVGKVVQVARGLAGFSIGDRVVSNGRHSEVVSVAANYCALVPPEVEDAQAAFTPLAAIALQGVRLAAPTLGEVFLVSGLGLVGLLAVQILRANGCRVIGADFDKDRLALARSYGAVPVDLSDPAALERAVSIETQGRGVDGVLICASTDSSEPVHQAAISSRKRGRIVLVGVTGLELSRADFYEKELTFQVSCSYGPGRHDPSYEKHGYDYPAAFVRWTAMRNFEAVLGLMADRKLDTSALVSHRFDLDRAAEAYTLLAGDTPSLGILLEYPERYRDIITAGERTIIVASSDRPSSATLGFIGAGNHAQRVLMPAFREAGARMKTVVSAGGLSAIGATSKFGFEISSTDAESILSDPEINGVVIATRHDTHAELTCRALAAGKHVFVEKPIAITRAQLASVRDAWAASQSSGTPRLLMAGFNRRFAPQVRKIKALLDSIAETKVFVITVNAGSLPEDHWTLDPQEGGGRIIGEACHFIDLLRHLAGSSIAGFSVSTPGGTGKDAPANDSLSVTLSFADGSIGTVHYLVNGHRSFPKERLEVFAGGRILQLANFRSLSGFGWSGFSRMNLWRQNKGGAKCAAAFVSAMKSGDPSPILPEELFEVADATFSIAERASIGAISARDAA